MRFINKTTKTLTSLKMSVFLLFLFIAALISATFIENKFDTNTADKLIYRSLWFSILISLIELNLISNIFIYKLYKKGKLPGFLIHSSFIIMIIGAGITRFTGWDGEIHIREGSKTDTVYIEDQVLITKIYLKADTLINILPIKISQISNNKFEQQFNVNNYNISISYKGYTYDSLEFAKNPEITQKEKIEFLALFNGREKKCILSEGDSIVLNGTKFIFGRSFSDSTISFFMSDSTVMLSSSNELIVSNSKLLSGNLKIDTVYAVDNGSVFNTQKGLLFQFLKRIKKTSPNTELLDALILNIKINNEDFEAVVFGKEHHIAHDQFFYFKDLKISFAYGFRSHQLPFKVYLKDFLLERYPGSEAPSFHTSDVEIIDLKNNVTKEYKISFNNVLDYNGYRFFQLSYDKDEKGTILSVNHDYWGTMITYISYIILFAGSVLLFFSKNSHIRSLLNDIRKK